MVLFAVRAVQSPALLERAVWILQNILRPVHVPPPRVVAARHAVRRNDFLQVARHHVLVIIVLGHEPAHFLSQKLHRRRVFLKENSPKKLVHARGLQLRSDLLNIRNVFDFDRIGRRSVHQRRVVVVPEPKVRRPGKLNDLRDLSRFFPQRPHKTILLTERAVRTARGRQTAGIPEQKPDLSGVAPRSALGLPREYRVEPPLNPRNRQRRVASVPHGIHHPRGVGQAFRRRFVCRLVQAQDSPKAHGKIPRPERLFFERHVLRILARRNEHGPLHARADRKEKLVGLPQFPGGRVRHAAGHFPGAFKRQFKLVFRQNFQPGLHRLLALGERQQEAERLSVRRKIRGLYVGGFLLPRVPGIPIRDGNGPRVGNRDAQRIRLQKAGGLNG